MYLLPYHSFEINAVSMLAPQLPWKEYWCWHNRREKWQTHSAVDPQFLWSTLVYGLNIVSKWGIPLSCVGLGSPGAPIPPGPNLLMVQVRPGESLEKRRQVRQPHCLFKILAIQPPAEASETSWLVEGCRNLMLAEEFPVIPIWICFLQTLVANPPGNGNSSF